MGEYLAVRRAVLDDLNLRLGLASPDCGLLSNSFASSTPVRVFPPSRGGGAGVDAGGAGCIRTHRASCGTGLEGSAPLVRGHDGGEARLQHHEDCVVQGPRVDGAGSVLELQGSGGVREEFDTVATVDSIASRGLVAVLGHVPGDGDRFHLSFAEPLIQTGVRERRGELLRDQQVIGTFRDRGMKGCSFAAVREDRGGGRSLLWSGFRSGFRLQPQPGEDLRDELVADLHRPMMLGESVLVDHADSDEGASAGGQEVPAGRGATHRQWTRPDETQSLCAPRWMDNVLHSNRAVSQVRRGEGTRFIAQASRW